MKLGSALYKSLMRTLRNQLIGRYFKIYLYTKEGRLLGRSKRFHFCICENGFKVKGLPIEIPILHAGIVDYYEVRHGKTLYFSGSVGGFGYYNLFLDNIRQCGGSIVTINDLTFSYPEGEVERGH